MQTLITARWFLIVTALIFGAAFLIPFAYPASQYWAVRPERLMMFVPPLQLAGTIGMSRHFAARGVAVKQLVQAGYVAAIAWLAALMGAAVSQASGPGGLVYGMLLLLPAAGVGLLAQILSFIGFMRVERTAP